MKNNCNRLYVSGDPHQSIYDKDPNTGLPVINVNDIGHITNTNEFKLTTIHRLTQSVIKLISSLLPSMEIFSAKSNAKKVDVTARLAKFTSKEEEINYITNQAFDAINIGQSSVVILPTHSDLLQFAALYNEVNGNLPWKRSDNRYGKPNYDVFNTYYNNSKLHCVGNGYGDLWTASRNKKLILMTYHSAKGLDFDNVYLPFLNTDADIRGETLFMVGLSRSKNSLTLSYTDTMHSYLKSIEKDCHNITDAITSINSDDEFDFEF
jgi:superfamily I DNA/RNA helicase